VSTHSFTREPPNIFQQHIREYFDRTRAECGLTEAICGKWAFEDLIPGLSDFDARFVFSDKTGPDDWVSISKAMGRAHSALCWEYPERARILEHLAGINLTWEEMSNHLFYYSEFHQWTFYHGPETKRSIIKGYLETRDWTEDDEIFSLKKFLTYYTPYDRGIDPAINLGAFESKYPLHSRFMHYFAPPVQAAVSIMLKRMVRGKFESLRLARDLFPGRDTIDMVTAAVERHYEIPEYYEEPELSKIENTLHLYLQAVYREILPRISVIPASPPDPPSLLSGRLASVKGAILSRFFDTVKFARQIGGRLLFYAEEIPHFDSEALIQVDTNRIRRMFFEYAFRLFGQIAWGEDLSPEKSLDRCRDQFLSASEVKAVEAYAAIFSRKSEFPRIRDFSRAVAEVTFPFQVVLEKLGHQARKLHAEKHVHSLR
jgi:hypothetical protein